MSFSEILDFLQQLNPVTATIRVVLAVILGGFIGLERGHHGRAAGLRTHILVCLGAAVCTLVGLYTGSPITVVCLSPVDACGQVMPWRSQWDSLPGCPFLQY